MPSQFWGIFEQATIELLNDLISLFVIIDRYKTKTTAFAGFPVFNDFGGNSIPTSAKTACSSWRSTSSFGRLPMYKRTDMEDTSRLR